MLEMGGGGSACFTRIDYGVGVCAIAGRTVGLGVNQGLGWGQGFGVGGMALAGSHLLLLYFPAPP